MKVKLATLEGECAREQAIVKEIRSLRDILNPPVKEAGAAPDPATAPVQASEGAPAETPEQTRAKLLERNSELEAIDPERRMIYAHVDEPSIAAIVSDWTGIPVGRMVKDEIENILNLPAILNKRVVGQSHGLAMISKRIETNRAKLDNPSKPIGVFMLCGPSGVGKTETALALAEEIGRAHV